MKMGKHFVDTAKKEAAAQHEATKDVFINSSEKQHTSNYNYLDSKTTNYKKSSADYIYFKEMARLYKKDFL